MAGRPTKYSPEVEKKICDALRAGNTHKAAVGYAGIHIDTFHSWMNEFSEFSEAVKKAEADVEVRNVAIIQKASDKSWTAAAWWLERRRTDDGFKNEHGTQKPIECMARPLKNHEGDVYDPFLGSGTTLIAANRANRRCFGMEIDPKYASVILARAEAEGIHPIELIEHG